MFSEVQNERVAGPLALHLHDVEGHALQEILKGGAYPDAVTL